MLKIAESVPSNSRNSVQFPQLQQFRIKPIPGFPYRNCIHILWTNHWTQHDVCGLGWGRIPESNGIPEIWAWNGIGTDFGNRWELILGAEPVPQCWTLRNRMYSQIGNEIVSIRIVFQTVSLPNRWHFYRLILK
jgi:hypothetical protein